MKTSYRSIKDVSEGLFKDRGSKFISFAYPVNDEEAVKSILNDLRKQFHDARHHCYAWKMGLEPANIRANDDGEPSNSAGKPILNQIEKYELTNILVVVIRYFGGTLLGVGGLINAYRTATEDAILNGKIVKRQVMKNIQIDFNYPEMNSVMRIIKEFKLKPTRQKFESSCEIDVSIPLGKLDKFIEKVSLIEGCRLKIQENNEL